jgi:hypothetical protein
MPGKAARDFPNTNPEFPNAARDFPNTNPEFPNAARDFPNTNPEFLNAIQAGRKNSRDQGTAGQEGSNDTMNSRNLVRRPAGAKPAWPGVSPPEPVVSLATGADV